MKVKIFTFNTHNLYKECTRRSPEGDRKALWNKHDLISNKKVESLHLY